MRFAVTIMYFPLSALTVRNMEERQDEIRSTCTCISLSLYQGLGGISGVRAYTIIKILSKGGNR